MSQIGEPVKAVPFEATVDGSGRLSSLRYAVPGYTLEPIGPVPATQVQATFSNFGAPVTVDRPANVVDAPPDFYGLLGAGG